VFYDQLEKICKEKGVSITPMVVELGLSKGNIRNWKNGTLPKYETRLKIAEYLKIPIEKLMTEQELESRQESSQMISRLVDLVASKTKSPDIDFEGIIDKILAIMEFDDDSFNITEHEKEVIIAYRKQPSMQLGVDRMLGVVPLGDEKEKTCLTKSTQNNKS